MKIATALVLTAVVWAMLQFVAPRYGPGAGSRFIERLKDIPPSIPLTADSLRKWAQDPANAKDVRGYVVPVIVPLDILFLLALGSFLGLASTALAGRIEALSIIPFWVWWIFPALYMIADLCEGGAIVSLLSRPDKIKHESFAVLRGLTTAKLVAIWFSVIEFIGLGALALLNYFRTLGA
jgi:formate-dependent nitrite reductase membrane component NrfD